MTVIVIGSINLDLSFHLPRFPSRGETMLCNSFAQGLGGKGANQAVAAARMGRGVVMLGAVGDDANGRDLLTAIASFGVNIAGVQTIAGSSTGVASISLAENDNSIIVSPGANALYDGAVPDGIEFDDPVTAIAQLETPIDAIRAALASLPDDCTRILNAAPALPEGASLFDVFDILVVNEGELEAYAPGAGDDFDSVSAHAGGLIRGRLKTVIVTLGRRGCLVVDGTGWQAIPAKDVAVVDTVGAGDCFCGVLAAAIDGKQSIAEASRLAGTAASLSVTRKGAAFAMPSREDVLGFDKEGIE